MQAVFWYLCFVRISSTVEYRYWKSISIIKRYSIDFAPSYTKKYRISIPMSCSFAVLMGDFRSDVSIDRRISWQLRDKAHNKHCCADFFSFSGRWNGYYIIYICIVILFHSHIHAQYDWFRRVFILLDQLCWTRGLITHTFTALYWNKWEQRKTINAKLHLLFKKKKSSCL